MLTRLPPPKLGLLSCTFQIAPWRMRFVIAGVLLGV